MLWKNLSYIHIIASYDESNMIFHEYHMSIMRHMRLIVIIDCESHETQPNFLLYLLVLLFDLINLLLRLQLIVELY